MELYRVEDYRRSRWKNGRGETLEIASFPPTAAIDNFDWRVSVATLDADAAFSVFAGIDRTLAIIEGAGIVLNVAGQAHCLDRGSAPLRFSGDAPAHATLIDGASVDLNVMTRRGNVDHKISAAGAGHTVRAGTSLVAIFATMPTTLATGGGTIELSNWQMLELHGDEIATIVSGGAFELRISGPYDSVFGR